MFNKTFHLSIGVGAIISFFVFILIGLFFKGSGYNDQLSTLLSVASFLFGIFVAFSIANNHSRLSKINETLKGDSAIILSIYEMLTVFGKETQEEVQKLLDKYLIDQIDYYLEDFRYSQQSFTNLYRYLINLEPRNKRQETVYDAIVNLLNNSMANRKHVETLVKQKMFTFEWISILMLLGLIIFLVFNINSGSAYSVLLSALLASASIILVFVLRDLDSLRWKEQSAIWEPLNSLFISLNLLPYYPKEVINRRGVQLTRGQEMRVVEYPDPYPEMTHKIVTVHTQE